MLGFIKKLFGIEDVDIVPILKAGAVILDVRTSQEFKRGHVRGAVNIPLQNISGRMMKIKKFKKPIITCCASGSRSRVAARQLKAAGLEAYNGGAWTKVSNLLKRK